jgi:DNA-3-methyladenine glycosylase
MAQRLSRDFYARDTIAVARELLGQRLVRVLEDGRRLSGRIVETEAYLGVEDPACHSFGGRRTPRTEVMYGDPGLSYIYFIYGMYFCFNAITMAREVPEAVLVRALEPLEGFDPENPQRDRLCNGPGKLCRQLGLMRDHNGLDLTACRQLFIESDRAVTNDSVVEGPRIGLGDRHDAVHWPLRFGIKNHPALSPARFPELDMNLADLKFKV